MISSAELNDLLAATLFVLHAHLKSAITRGTNFADVVRVYCGTPEPKVPVSSLLGLEHFRDNDLPRKLRRQIRARHSSHQTPKVVPTRILFDTALFVLELTPGASAKIGYLQDVSQLEYECDQTRAMLDEGVKPVLQEFCSRQL